MKQKLYSITLTCVLALGSMPNAFGEDRDTYRDKRVLLISIDGMHAVDFQNCANGIAGGQPYCPNMAALAQSGVTFTDASTSKPSDSFPGILALVAGATPRSAGVYYDVSYTRELAPAGKCVVGVPGPGTDVVFDESLDYTLNDLTGGGGINPANLPLDPMHGCKPVYPHNYVRVNTIFSVLHTHGHYVAWSDKHPAYDIVRGHTDVGVPNDNVDDLNSPEINSVVVPVPNVAGFSNNCAKPDTSDLSAWTNSFQNIQCYDLQKVQILLNQIDGKTSDGKNSAPVPTIFGMNFQAVSVGQKLIDAKGVIGGYLDPKADVMGPLGKPNAALLSEIVFVDNAIGALVAELHKKGLDKSTTIVIGAKHGQSAIDISRLTKIKATQPAKIVGSLLAGSSDDDVSLMWLNSSKDTQTAVSLLEANEAAAGIGEIFAGPSMKTLFGDPAKDPRVPDIAVQPNVGVIYTGSTTKVSEHGGFSNDDTHTMLLVSSPKLSPATVTVHVDNAQVAPTIVSILGYAPSELDAVVLEGTQVLPGLGKE
jgi:hypothetical protein